MTCRNGGTALAFVQIGFPMWRSYMRQSLLSTLCGRSFGPLNGQRPLIVLRSIRICAPTLFYARVSQSYPRAAEFALSEPYKVL